MENIDWMSVDDALDRLSKRVNTEHLGGDYFMERLANVTINLRISIDISCLCRHRKVFLSFHLNSHLQPLKYVHMSDTLFRFCVKFHIIITEQH